MIKENTKLNDIILKIDDNNFIDLKKLKGKKTIIYFYPKDDTPGCTKEAIEFSNFYSILKKNNVEVFGVSKDSAEKHKKFISKYDLKFKLITDDGTLCEKFGVWVEKSMYGKKYMGIERTTFLINEDLQVIKIWKKVKVKGHVDEVINHIKLND